MEVWSNEVIGVRFMRSESAAIVCKTVQNSDTRNAIGLYFCVFAFNLKCITIASYSEHNIYVVAYVCDWVYWSVYLAIGLYYVQRKPMYRRSMSSGTWTMFRLSGDVRGKWKVYLHRLTAPVKCIGIHSYSSRRMDTDLVASGVESITYVHMPIGYSVDVRKISTMTDDSKRILNLEDETNTIRLLRLRVFAMW